jgi:hypothetical protein
MRRVRLHCAGFTLTRPAVGRSLRSTSRYYDKVIEITKLFLLFALFCTVFAIWKHLEAFGSIWKHLEARKRYAAGAQF